MAPETCALDLAGLALAPGEGRRFELDVRIGELCFGGERYRADPQPTPARLDVSRLSGPGWALRLRLGTAVVGPCTRCLKEAAPLIAVDAQEVHVESAEGPAGGEDELESPYVTDGVLEVAAWARDALVLGLPVKVLCREDCPGLCPVCAADLAEAGPGHAHERAPDPRWAKLRELSG